MTSEQRQQIRRLHAVILDYENEHAGDQPEAGCECDLCKAALQTVLDTAALLKLPPPTGPQCDGSGELWRVINPDWPKGDKPAIERTGEQCPGCSRCKPPTQVEGDEFAQQEKLDRLAKEIVAEHQVNEATAYAMARERLAKTERGEQDSYRLIVTEHPASNERRYACSACGIEFMVPLDDAALPAERECGGCNRMLPTVRQPEGGDEEDWPTEIPISFNDGRPYVNWIAEDFRPTRAYVPASSQDSSGPTIKDVEGLFEEARREANREEDRANKAEAERDRLQESARIAHEEEARLTAAAEQGRQRAETALEELAKEFKRRADECMRLRGDLKPGSTGYAIADACVAEWEKAARAAREKAAKLKGGGL